MQWQGQNLDHDFPVNLLWLFEIAHIYLHMQEFLADLKDTDRNSEVNRILSAFKLNPFQILGLKLDADRSSIRQAYRKASLMVHPDKCTHAKATTAFDKLGQAQKDLDSDDQWNELQYVFGIAKGEKSDSILHASLVHMHLRFQALPKPNFTLKDDLVSDAPVLMFSSQIPLILKII